MILQFRGKMKSPTRIIISFLTMTTPALADVYLPSIFSDNMVLQQNSTVTIWGFAKAGEPVRITPGWSDESYSLKAPSPGNWQLEIQTPGAGGPYDIVVEGYNSFTIRNVLIGEVWFVSGQSNMEWTARMGIVDAEKEIAASDYPQIRLFSTAHMTAYHPQMHLIGRWKECSPESMVDFSAVAYFFGRKLHKELNVPIGLINSSWGGTPAEAWTPQKDVMKNPILRDISKNMPEVPWGPVRAGSLYNAMVAPIKPFRIRGALWYQGEANVGHHETYDELLETMITSWRREWGYDFPFYFAQIAPWKYGDGDSGAAMRYCQSEVLRVPGTAMVVTSDTVDDITDIHPQNKQEVGRRFANIALSDAYGRELGIVRSPVFERAVVEGQSVRVYFRHAENGLTSRNGPPTHFEICGSDGIYHPASATIEESTVLVESDSVTNPAGIRFAWHSEAIPNLFNQEGLPVSVFKCAL